MLVMYQRSSGIPNLSMKVFALLILSLCLFSCDDDDSKPKGKYESGVIVVSEGGFGDANGTVTHYNPVSGEVEQNIFRNAAGSFAGDVAQSITFHGDKGYLVLNGGNTVEVVDGNSFERLSTISNAALDKPRYVEIINDKAYISVWGPYEEGGYSLIDSYVLVVDLSNNTVVEKIETDEGTDKLLYTGNYLFASNNNFGGSSTVAVINPSNNTLVDQLQLASGPAGLVSDANGKVWVICTGVYGATSGQLFRINPSNLNIEETIEIDLKVNGDLAVTPDKGSLIYNSGKDIYKISITATAAPTEPIFEASEVVTNYALNVDPGTGDIWIADALNYATEGKVYIYNASGALQSSFTTGISPTQIHFK